MQFSHLPVTYDFSNNRGGGNGRTPAVSADDTALRKKQTGNPETVDKNEIRQWRHLGDSSPHRLEGGLVNVEVVNLFWGGGPDGPSESPVDDLAVEPLSCGRRQKLRISNPGDRAVWM